MEISKFELAAIKRVNQNSKQVVRRLNTLKKKIDALTEEYNQGVEEYKAVEAYVVTKYGFYSEQILSGEADAILADMKAKQEAEASQTEAPAEEVPAPTIEDAPAEEPAEDNLDPFAE